MAKICVTYFMDDPNRKKIRLFFFEIEVWFIKYSKPTVGYSWRLRLQKRKKPIKPFSWKEAGLKTNRPNQRLFFPPLVEAKIPHSRRPRYDSIRMSTIGWKRFILRDSAVLMIRGCDRFPHSL